MGLFDRFKSALEDGIEKALQDDRKRGPVIPDEPAPEEEAAVEEDAPVAEEPEYDTDAGEAEEVPEEDDDDDEAAENRAKAIFIIYLKRLKAPFGPSTVLADASGGNKPQCLLMRDRAEDPDMAHCFFGAPVGQLMSKALDELESWKEETEEDIVPVIDIVTDARAYNCDIDDETLRKVVYYIVNEFGEEAFEVKGNIPFTDSLIRVVEEVDGRNVVKDFLAYPDWTGLDDDDDKWVSRMIGEHGIRP